MNTHSLPSAVPALIQFVYDIGTPADRAAGKGCCREDAVIRAVSFYCFPLPCVDGHMVDIAVFRVEDQVSRLSGGWCDLGSDLRLRFRYPGKGNTDPCVDLLHQAGAVAAVVDIIAAPEVPSAGEAGCPQVSRKTRMMACTAAVRPDVRKCLRHPG